MRRICLGCQTKEAPVWLTEKGPVSAAIGAPIRWCVGVYPDVAFSKGFSESLYGESSGKAYMTLHAYTVVGRWQRRATLLPGLVTVAQGRIVARSDQTQKRRVETQRRRGAAKAAWKDSALPGWLDEGVYCVEILPRLKQVSLSETVKDAKYRELAMSRNHRAYLDQRETKLPRRMVH